MNRPKLVEYDELDGLTIMDEDEFIDEINMYCDELERKLKFRNDILSCIGETLVDESKMNITTKCAIKRIREYMGKLNDERKYIDELEATLKCTQDSWLGTSDELDKHMKALDKACEKLAFASNEHIIEELGSFTFGELNRTKEQWKEWALKNE